MTFHKTKRAVILAVAASWLVLCIAGTSAAHAEDSEAGAAGEEGASKEGKGEKDGAGEAEKSEALNTIGVNAALALELGDGVKVGGGGNISYERELIPKDLQMELVVGMGGASRTA
jgi:hypothetical protein